MASPTDDELKAAIKIAISYAPIEADHLYLGGGTFTIDEHIQGDMAQRILASFYHHGWVVTEKA